MGEFVTKVGLTLITVAVAVGVSAAIWISANLVVNQVHRYWSRFYALSFAGCGFLAGVLLSGNRITRYSGPADSALAKFGYWVWLPLVIAIGAGVVGLLLGSVEPRSTRLLIGIGGLGGLGVFAGAMVREEWFPDFEIVPIVVWPIVGAVVGAAIGVVNKRGPVGPALLGAAVLWLVGAWAMPDLGNDGTLAWTIVAIAVPAALVGARQALRPIPNPSERSVFDRKARAAIFLGPALIFIFATLLVPTIGTLLLSFKDAEGEDFIGTDNYQSIFNDPTSWDVSNWSDMFGSKLLWIGLALLAIFLILGLRAKRTTGRMVELGSPSSGPLLIGALFVTFAVLTTSRGTIFNNIWWVIVVTLFATTIGLAIAVLAENARYEKVAKSLVFMPMALSMVGASVIWRLMYVARDSSKEQTGVMNSLWVGLGRLANGEDVAGTALYFLLAFAGLALAIGALSRRDWNRAGIYTVGTVAIIVMLSLVWNSLGGTGTRILFGGTLTLVLAALVAAIVRALSDREPARAAIPAVAALVLAWFLVRFWTGSPDPDAIYFVPDGPFNNMWLMVVLIWIQAGFAMVIFSAALASVPDDYIEAARVDGANTSQIFWRIKLPQIAPTIGVVVTTLIVLIMKVYDIVKVMTNGNFDTQVLANQMFQEAFINTNRGLGAALAALIFVSVLPIMVMNIRRMQKEA